MCALAHFFYADWCRLRACRYRCATHVILESGSGEDEHQADWLRAGVLQSDLGIRGDKHGAAGVYVGFTDSEVDVRLASLNDKNFVLLQMAVSTNAPAGRNLFRAHDQVLRVVVLRADLEHELRS